MLQFTGEKGVADTKISYVVGPSGAKEIVVADYDGVGTSPVTRNGSINLSPVWSPDARSIAFTSFMNGYPDLFRLFPFEPRRGIQTLASFHGINSSPAWSPDGQFLALTLSKDGNPEIYILTVATGALQRLTRHASIDTEPSWSPTGQQIAFVSDRAGQPRIFVMDRDGSNVRQLTNGGFHTQPRWSPKGDTIVYTQREGTHNLWAISPGGTNARPLTNGQGDNQGAAWAPDGRHLAFQSNRSGRLAGLHHAARRHVHDTDHVRRGGVHKSLMVAAPPVIALWPNNGRSDQKAQGGVMVTRAAQVTLMSLLLAGLMITGCAKRPATTAASAARQRRRPRRARRRLRPERAFARGRAGARPRLRRRPRPRLRGPCRRSSWPSRR